MSESLDLKDQSRLERSLAARETIIATLMSDGRLPYNKDDKIMLIQALDGLDRTVLSKAKLKSDDQNAKSQRDTAKMIADVLSRVSTASLTRTGVPSLPSDIVIDDLVPGETSLGLQDLTYDEFDAT